MRPSRSGKPGSRSLIIGVAIVAYATAFAGTFQFDDYHVIVDNDAVHSLAGWSGHLDGLRPVTKLVTTLNWTSGAGLVGFHAVNLAIHIATALLAYRLLARIAGAAPALLASLVFAVHPINTEAVTYISGRATSLAALFALASVLAYLRGRDRGSRTWLYGISPALFVIAFFAKETAIVVPALLVLVGVVERRSLAEMTRAQAAHWLVLVGLAGVVLFHPAYRHSLDYSLGIRGLGESLRGDVAGTWYLLGKLVWPAQLDIDPALAVPPLDAALVAKALVLVVLAGVTVANVRRRPWLAFGLSWFAIALVPVMSIVPRRDVVSEHEVYLASIGLVLVASVLACEIGARMQAMQRRLVATVVIATLAIVTAVRSLDYRTEIALWESSVHANPDNARAFNNLGHAYELDGDRGAAERAYVRALALRPDYAKARINLDTLDVGD